MDICLRRLLFIHILQ